MSSYGPTDERMSLRNNYVPQGVSDIAPRCPICIERPDVAPTSILRSADKRSTAHGITGHTLFAQMVWETGIYKDDNPDEWREAKRIATERRMHP